VSRPRWPWVPAVGTGTGQARAAGHAHARPGAPGLPWMYAADLAKP